MRRDARSPAAYRRDVSGDQRKLLEAIRAVVGVDAAGTGGSYLPGVR